MPDEYFKLKCEFCKQQFANQQGLSMHLLCKHGDKPSSTKLSSTEPSTAQPVEQSSTVSTPSTADQSLAVAHSSTTNEQDSLKRIENRCGREVRTSITNGFKVRVIAAVASGEKPIDAAKKFNVNRSQISEWLKNKDVINKAAVKENKQHFKVRPTVKYNALHDELETFS